MNTPITRREFLKLAGLLPLSFAIPPSITSTSSADGIANGENILIIVFDAWSASNISLLGYSRKTTPNLARLAEKAIVYHNHFAGGHFTSPGTASLLTGTTPWTHGAFAFHSTVIDALSDNNIFNAFQGHHRLAYTHNPLADSLLQQFVTEIDDFTSWEKLFIESDTLVNTVLKNDFDVASIGWNRIFKNQADGYSYSLFLSQIYEYLNRSKVQQLEQIMPNFPYGLPNYDDTVYFTLEQGIDWLAALSSDIPQPFMGYFHFLPPHDPYRTRIDFINSFSEDDYQPIQKPYNIFKENKLEERISLQRRWYDEYILYVDSEFARLYDHWEQIGLLENTWIILTSDHGEIFERGLIRHSAPVYYRPAMNIPLVIFPPGQANRIDVHENTSAIDLLPTLSHITKQTIPDWAEGTILPPFAKSSNSPGPDITTLHVQARDKNGIVSKASAMIVRGDYKLMWLFGYEEIDQPQGEIIELYDIRNDPEELHNLYSARKDVSNELLDILKAKLEELNRNYQQ